MQPPAQGETLDFKFLGEWDRLGYRVSSDTMLLSHREFDDSSLGARMGEHIVLHSRFRIHYKERDGILVDDALFGTSQRPLAVDRTQLIIALEGETLLRTNRGQQIIRAGDCVIQRHSQPWTGRHEGRVGVLIVEWETGMLATRMLPPGTCEPLPAETARRISELVPLLRNKETSPETAAEACQAILALLRAEGFPFDPVTAGDLQEPLPPFFAPLSRAFDAALSSFTQPALLDLERTLGLSERQVQRQLLRFNEHYTIHSSGRWRDLIRWWRLPMGAALMSSPKATTEGVSRKLGYASARAFCDAFAAAGLPSPGSIRDALRRLG